MPPSASSNQLNKSFRLHLAGLLYFLSRFSVVALVFTVSGLFFLEGLVEMRWLIGGAGATVVLFLGYYLAASGLRCAACASPVLMDNGTRKHPHAARFPGLNHRARVAWDILFSSSYQCMYCMTRCRCKKGWGGKPARDSNYNAAQMRGEPESFPNSIFREVGDQVIDVPVSFAEAEPDESSAVVERPASNVFAAAKVFPNARTVPVSLITPQPPPAPPPRPQSATEPVTIEAPAPPGPAAPQRGSAPVPWAVPLYSTPATHTSMNPITPGPSPASSPFLAAAAAMPPPPTPPLPVMPPARTGPTPAPAADFHEEFPHVEANALPDGPPPWTIPAMPYTAPVPASVAPAPAPKPLPTAGNAADHLLKEVVSLLAEGQQAIASAFQGLITRLESRLTVVAQAPDPAPVAVPDVPAHAAVVPAPAQQPVMITALQPAAPPAAPAPEPLQPVLPALLTRAQRPSAPPAPAMPPQEKTSFVPPPNLPAVYHIPPPPPVAHPMPVTATIPLPPAAPMPAPVPAEPDAAPRRRFVRPGGAAAQQLNDLLNGTFDEPAAPPADFNNDGQKAPVADLHPGRGVPTVTAPVPALPPEPIHPVVQRQCNPPQVPAPSPFAVSDTPVYAPPGAPQQPAPFTFLKRDGDHFALAQPAEDSLDDAVPPWMQPIGVAHERN